MNRLAQICLSEERYQHYRLSHELCLADWQYCLEMAHYAGFEVDNYVDRVNQQQTDAQIKITSIEDKLKCLQLIDDHTGTNMVGGFNCELRAAKRIPKINR
jgi:hypothetical protein